MVQNAGYRLKNRQPPRREKRKNSDLLPTFQPTFSLEWSEIQSGIVKLKIKI